MCWLSWNLGASTSWNPQGLSRIVMGLLYLIPGFMFLHCYIKVKVKWSRYRPGVAKTVGRGIAVLFHDRGTGRGWVVSSTPRPHFTPGKDPVPIVQEAVWAPGQVWTGGISRPHRNLIPDRPARTSVAIPTELPGPHCYINSASNYPSKRWINPYPANVENMVSS